MSSTKKGLRTVDWEFVEGIKMSELRINKDRKVLNYIISNLIKSESLYDFQMSKSDVAILKYFQIIQIAMNELVNDVCTMKKEKETETIIKEVTKVIKVYECPFCANSFANKDTLGTHILKYHMKKNDSTEESQREYEHIISAFGNRIEDNQRTVSETLQDQYSRIRSLISEILKMDECDEDD